jgi:hypothetical protein
MSNAADRAPLPERLEFRLRREGAFLQVETDGTVRVGNAEGCLAIGPSGVRIWSRSMTLELGA